MAQQGEPAQPATAAYLKGLTVLYVEDDEEVREQTIRILARWVRRVLPAEEGIAGLQIYHTAHPDLVITDIQMPGMDGLTLTEAIRAQDAALPIIVITAFETTALMMRSIELNVDRYVLKPVEGNRLHAALLACAQRLHAQAQLGRMRELEAEAMRTRQREAIGYLARGLAHDFNNLLQATLACITVAREASAPESPVRRILDLSSQSTARAQDLARRLAFLARGSSAPATPGSLEPLIREALEEVFADTEITLACHWPAELPELRLEPVAMKEALLHLFRNALEAMPSGGALKVRAQRKALGTAESLRLPPGDYVEITIQDSGRGITAENLPRIFDPYFTTKPLSSQKGTGLGLALCEAVVNSHGGLLTVESRPWEGATFRLWLPVAGGDTA
jgi:signal transduction histidine kinase